MQLHTARLCLDCEEIHDGQTCPICSSESFAYISRWIPAPDAGRNRDRPSRPRRPKYTGSCSPPNQAPPTASRWLKRGVFGLAAVSAAAWALKRPAPVEPAGPGRLSKDAA